jgi:hypothetical protein
MLKVFSFAIFINPELLFQKLPAKKLKVSPQKAKSKPFKIKNNEKIREHQRKTVVNFLCVLYPSPSDDFAATSALSGFEKSGA